MGTEKDTYYEKTVDLILSVFKDLRNDNSYAKRNELSDRKRNTIAKAYGPTFSGSNVLFCDKFLLFAPSLVATHEALHSNLFNVCAAPKNVLRFDRIKEIRYELMPCHTSIRITSTAGATMKLYDGVPQSQDYSVAKSYVHSVQTGSYKSYTICLLSCIYALSAMHRCKPTEYASTYKTIEKNIKQLVAYYRATNNTERKYGNFFSFDFVICDYDPETVEKGLDNIESVMEDLEAIHEEEKAERREQFSRALERQMDKAREQLENQRK